MAASLFPFLPEMAQVLGAAKRFLLSRKCPEEASVVRFSLSRGENILLPPLIHMEKASVCQVGRECACKAGEKATVKAFCREL